uniref:Argonaute-like protein n=1 Tax=Bursaphelenchus xylophilus TaxID=6326 RepID=A0A1I7S4G0_BURXY
MGNETSVEAHQPLAQKHLTITLERPDVLALMDIDGDHGVAYQLIKNSWLDEIIDVKKVMYMHCFQLPNKPFSTPLLTSVNNPAYIQANARVRHAFCNVLGKMDEMGIKLITTAYLGKIFTRTTMFFQRSINNAHDQSYNPVNAEERFLCVAIRSYNSLLIPASPAYCRFPVSWVHHEFSSLIEKEDINDDYMEITFKEAPFAPYQTNYESMIHAKRLFLGLVRQLSQRGYEYVAPISVKGGSRNDTMLFRMTRQPPPTDKVYFFISPEEKNRLRLYEAPPGVADIVRKSISAITLKEVKRPYMGCIEVLFAGQPFYADSKLLTQTQLDILEMIGNLWIAGYKLVGSLQTTLNMCEKAVMLFENTTEEPVPMFAVSFQRADTIQVISAPGKIRTLIREIVLGHWTKGIQEEFEIVKGMAIKLRGRPFGSRDVSADCQHGLHMLLFIVDTLYKVGWKLKTTLDVGGKPVSDGEMAYIEDGVMLIFVAAPNDDDCGKNGKVHGVDF